MPLEKLGPYRLEKLLGRGGMGAVYVGVNEATGERAAIKVLAAHLSDNADFRERFVSEVETLKKLKHPNIVQLVAYGEEGEHLFYAMELVEGRSLQEELQAGRRFNWREVARMGVEICRALKHAHDSGVIHRDLKPANLLLDKQGQVKLTDFGIAKLYGSTQITVAGGVLGTADYMSPEQAEGKSVNVRSDLYSLGSVLYALITGRPPFAAKSMAEVIHGLRFEKPIAPHRLSPDLPEQFDAIIMQLLEKEPSKRSASAFAVGNYLRAMEHALSLETQVGPAIPPDLPPDTPPSRPVDLGPDATQISISRSAPHPTVFNPGVTAHMEDTGDDDLRLVADIVTSAPGSSTAVGSQTIVQKGATPDIPAIRSRFITVEDEEAVRQQRDRRHDDGPPTWVLLTGMSIAVALLVGIFTYLLLPPSANVLYERIAAAAHDADKLQAAEPDVRQFLERFPDDNRAPTVKEYQQTLDAAKRERQLQVRAKIGGGQLSPIERTYADALRMAETDPDKAMVRLRSLIAVFGGKDDTTDDAQSTNVTLELAKKQLAELEEANAATATELRKIIAARLTDAADLQQESPAEAAAIYRGICELYGDKPWAADFVKQAQAGLK